MIKNGQFFKGEAEIRRIIPEGHKVVVVPSGSGLQAYGDQKFVGCRSGVRAIDLLSTGARLLHKEVRIIP